MIVDYPDIPHPPGRPVNREDLLQALWPARCQRMSKRERVSGPDEMFADCRALVEHAEWFDFGRIDMQVMQKHSHVAGDLLEASIPIAPPYQFSVFRYRCHNFAAPKNMEVDEVLLINYAMVAPAEVQRDFGLKLLRPPAVLVAPLIHVRRIMFTAQKLPVMIDSSMAYGMEAFGEDGEAVQDTMGLYAALWAVLNCRNIRKRIVVPSAKLQKVRLKAGKPPLRQVTHIDTAMFEAAAKSPVPAGHHASPKMHLRRGHLWTLPSGGRRWRRHCIVNADTSAHAARDHYEVRPGT